MDQHQFLQVARRLEEKYGKMKENEEDKYAMLLFSMESNLLKTRRKEPKANSRRLEEAILLALYEVGNRLQTECKDVSSYESRENTLLKDALLKSFDPFTNEEIRTALQETRQMDLEDQGALTRYYKEPVMCMLRIKDSVAHWLKRSGSDGYFDFLEGWLGDKVPNDGKMNYSIYAGTGKM